MRQIILRPLLRNTWPGIIKYKNCYEDLAPYFTRSGRVYTGLTTEDATRLGERLGLDLSPGSDYWKDFFVRTFGKDLYLDLEDPSDELKYLFLKNHKRVKNSLAENKSTANFVLVNKEEEAARANAINEIKITAVSEFSKMTPEEMRKCLRLFGKNASNMSDSLVKSRLFDIVEGDPKSFVKRWVENMDRNTEFLLESALASNIIRKSRNIYTYGSDTVGRSKGEAIAFLDDLKNQDIRIAIQKQVEGKNYIESEVELPETKVKAVDDEPLEEKEEKAKARPTKRKYKEDTI